MKTTPAIVTRNGMDCFHPSLNIDINKAGFANLKPTINNILAKTARGIRFRTNGIKLTQMRIKRPCKIAASFVLPPD